MSLQAGSFGFVLSLPCGLDLSTATDINLLIKSPVPGAPAVVRNIPVGSGIVDGPTGNIAYQVVDGDFPTPGIYRLQVHDVSLGRSVFSTVATLVVKPNLD